MLALLIPGVKMGASDSGTPTVTAATLPTLGAGR
jgi:hypothetical protein